MVNKAISLGGANGLFVELHGVESPTFDTRDFSADQRGAVLEILRAMVSPNSHLPVVSSQCFDMLRLLQAG
jgi:hypothetical protein